MSTENNENDSKLGIILFMGFALITSIALLLTACTSAQNAGNMNGNAVKNSNNGNGDSNPTMTKKDPSSEIVVKDTKSAPEMTQDQIIALIPDGEYHKNLTYKYHAGEEHIAVSITVKDDVVTEASIKPLGTPAAYSLKLMTAVNAALPDLVVGKKVEEISIPKQVSGSSLTTAAFKEYFESLKVQ